MEFKRLNIYETGISYWLFAISLYIFVAMIGCVASQEPIAKSQEPEGTPSGEPTSNLTKQSEVLTNVGEPQTSNGSTELAEVIQHLISLLGNDDWQTREKAQEELIEIGEGLIQEYRKLKRTQMNADVIARSEATKQSQHPNEIASLPLAMTLRPIKEFAHALREACQDEDPEIRMRANKIRQHFYYLTSPKIAFVSWRDSYDEIYVMDANPEPITGSGQVGKNQKRLTKTSVDNGCPDWSPDGTKITFSSNRNGTFQIYVMDVDPEPITGSGQVGKNQKRLTENNADEWSPAWSPDGTKIAFVSERDGNREIYVMAVDPEPITGSGQVGKNQRKLADGDSPAWSPDGTKIAFMSDRDGNGEIYVTDTDGRNQKRLTKNETSDTEPSWYPLSFPEISVLFGPLETDNGCR